MKNSTLTLPLNDLALVRTLRPASLPLTSCFPPFGVLLNELFLLLLLLLSRSRPLPNPRPATSLHCSLRWFSLSPSAITRSTSVLESDRRGNGGCSSGALGLRRNHLKLFARGRTVGLGGPELGCEEDHVRWDLFSGVKGGEIVCAWNRGRGKINVSQRV